MDKNFDQRHGCGARRGRSGIVDPITSDGAANAKCAFTRRSLFFFGLWIIIGGVASTVKWLLTGSERSNSVC